MCPWKLKEGNWALQQGQAGLSTIVYHRHPARMAVLMNCSVRNSETPPVQLSLSHGDLSLANRNSPLLTHSSDGPWDPQSSELQDCVCGNDKPPSNCKPGQDLLLQMDAHKSAWPDRIHPTALRELPGVIARPLLIIFQQSGECEEVPGKWKLADFVPAFKKEAPGNCRPVSLNSVPGRIVEITLGVTEKYLKRNVAIGQSQEGAQETGSSVQLT